MSNLLRMDYINNLPQPFLAEFFDGTTFEVDLICVETGLVTLNVMGMLEPFNKISDFRSFIDIDGVRHDPDSFYSDYEEE